MKLVLFDYLEEKMKENKREYNPVLDHTLKTLGIRCLKQIELARHLGINEVAFTK